MVIHCESTVDDLFGGFLETFCEKGKHGNKNVFNSLIQIKPIIYL